MKGIFELTALPPGKMGKIVEIKAKGRKKIFFQDLGILPGIKIKVLRKSPLGDPTAYLIRGLTLALRHKEAREILVQLENEEENKNDFIRPNPE